MAERSSKGKKKGAAPVTTRSAPKKGSTTGSRRIAKPSAAAASAVKKLSTRAAGSGKRPQARAVPAKTGKKSASAVPKGPTPRVARNVAVAAARGALAGGTLPVHVVTVEDVYSGDPGNSPGSAEFAYRILTEGDSWFTIGGIPSSNLLYELRLPRQGIVVNVAYPGDTLMHIAQLASNRDLKRMLTERFGYRWHVIVLSAGGNDLMDRASRVLRNPGTGSNDPRDYVSVAEIERFVADVQQGYRTIVGLRDSSQSANKGVPIVAHCYDFPTPRNSPARFFAVGLLGPWLHKAFNDRNIGQAMRVPISNYLVNVLAEAIAVLASGQAALPDFHFVDTRGTLQRAAVGATGQSGDWLNEIHPSQAGYRKIADRIEAKIVSLLPT